MNLSYFEEKKILKYNFPLSNVCSMKTGGNAKYAFLPSEKKDIVEITDFLKTNRIKYKILGNGSNVLFPDCGYDGAVVLTSGMKEIYDIKNGEYVSFDETNDKQERFIYVSAGVSLTAVSGKMSRLGYTGLEFAYGIPASVGGAVYMNAGAYGGEMGNIICKVEYVDENGEFKYLDNEPEKNYFTYRHSFFMEHPEYVITGVILKLNKATDMNPMDQAEKNMQARKGKQPLEYPSCGSAFKRPEGYFAGALIEQAGLKGKNIGGAYVSEKHAGFIVDKGSATTADVVALLAYVKDEVYKMSGVVLEPEIRIIED